MSKLKRIFYIYTEASMAVVMLICALIEAICLIYTPEQGLSYLFLAAAIAFTAIAVHNVRYIVRHERKSAR